MSKSTEKLQEMKILIVDDTPANLDVLRNMLTEHGFNISIAPSGEVALKSAPKIQPDLILLDVMMPGINGFETCQKLKADKLTQDIPVIFITAKTEANDIVEGFAVGGADYIAKPFYQEEVMARVITQLKLSKTTRDLKQAIVSMHEAKDDSVAKSEFLSRMSHELRTPLNAILGFTQLLDMGKNPPLTDTQKQNIDQISDSGKHLLSLIEEVLDVSNLDSDEFNILSERIALRPLIKDVVASVASQAEKRGVTITNNITSNIFVKGEGQRVNQVLVNLLSNAIKYNKDSGEVTIDLKENEGLAAISITDTGDGIPIDHIEHIFSPLFRLENHKTQVDGVGTGLTVAKKLTELMHGRITVESKLDEGSCFTVELKSIP